ncbi:hypothetical protein F2Q70_00017957 [Brassica cretica]|uniref:Disease resistance protein Roq1-like winged-helix domain-containing protein n=1 Tax=Brassica cretica TaxID=69181 RepID=A0A8S9HW00_BRACR|nr:hypothetical protein F2Q70_00017957 [Brassica cretica]
MLCQSAFRKKSPPEGFDELVVEITRLVGSLPLGLTVLGSSLRGRDMEYWIDLLPRLQNGIDGKIEKTLRISYDGLSSEDKAIFRHVACLFNGAKVTNLKLLLADSGLNVNIGLKNLADRSLIHLRKGHVEMHRLLQEMGKKVVRLEKPENQEFLMDSQDICDVLSEGIGTQKVIGITLDIDEIDEFYVHKSAFTRMRNLRFLKLYSRLRLYREVKLQLHGNFNYLPPKLKLLHWDEFPMRYMPSKFRPENLVELIMEDSKLEKLWEGILTLPCLKEMDLSGSQNLIEMPDLSKATNLETLKLRNCYSLVKLPSSIPHPNKLTTINLKNCRNLETIPIGISLKSLDVLNLYGCSMLRTIPLFSVNISHLNDQLVLDALAVQTQWFGNGSIIIVVTHDKSLLRSHGIDHIYEVCLPSEELALKIFCQSTFGQDYPPECFRELAFEVVSCAYHLPFGLQYFGWYLRGRGKEKWIDMMSKLHMCLDEIIKRTRRFHYDVLLNEKHKLIFRYIACLLNFEKVRDIEWLLADSDLGVKTGLKILVDKSLLRAREDTIEMQCLLQEMGKDIVRAQSNEAREREFLVDTKDICHVLEDNIATTKLLGISLDMDEIDELHIHESAFKGLCNLSFLISYTNHKKEVRWHIPKEFDYFPYRLRLRWDNCPLRCMPSKFCPSNLVKLQMLGSKLQKLWEGVQRLKVLGVGKIPENNDNPSPPSADKSLSLASLRVQTQQNSVNSPVLAATPGKVFGPKKNLAKELDKESGVKRTLAEEFGSVAKATDLDSQHLDFLVVSPAKTTKDDKVPAYGRACRGKHTVNDEDAADKKKQSRQMLR